MDIQFIKLGGIPTKELSNGSISETSRLILESKEDSKENTENEENKTIMNSNFIQVTNADEEFLNKSELEISTTEFIIDEDNYNISPTMTSDSCVDPLAIDDFSVEEITTNLNESQFSLSKDNIIYIVDVDDIKGNTLNNQTINSIKISSIEDIHNKMSRNCQVKNENNVNLSRNQNRQKSTTNNDENEMPSDGSDSGLGLESNILQIENYHKLDNTISIIDKNDLVNSTLNKIPTKSSLKRRSNILEESISLPIKRGKKSIQFDNVKVFYFPRIQGFCCVPSQGGCTLGMGAKHVQSKNYKLSDHVSEHNGDDKMSMQVCNAKGSSSDETDSDEDLSEENVSDLDPDSSGFLQPVPVKTRRALLKAAGIKKIDSTEKDDCRAIRSSREYCGCLCRGFCDPDTCSCSQSGIKCQVDRPNFPCGCSRDGCANIHGRVEFNPSRVRTHFIHTIMRLEIENKSKSTFIHDMPATQRFFPNANPTDIIYGSENSGIIQNSLQFFPDTISVVNNDNNFDIFPLHNGGENSRINLSTASDMNATGELPYPVLKSILSPTHNYPNDESIDSSKSIKDTPSNGNNKSSTCVSSDINESRFYGNYAQSYESFSAAYTNFLEEQFIDKNNSEISDLNSPSLNYNQNQLEVSPVHDLLNINRNHSLPLYPTIAPEIVPKINESEKLELYNSPITKDSEIIKIEFPITNIENTSSVTKLCTLAPTAQTSTSIFEGTSTTVASNYVSSPSSFETKDSLTNVTDCTSTTSASSISNGDIIEKNCVETKIPFNELEENSFCSADLKTELPQCDFQEEKLSLSSSPTSNSIKQEISIKTSINESNFATTTEESKKQYLSFNLTNSSSNLSLTINTNNDDVSGTLFNIPSSTNVDLLEDIK